MHQIATVSRILLMTVLVSVLGQSVASAQTMSHPDSISPLKPNPYLKHNEPWRWDIRSRVLLQSGFYTRIYQEYIEEVSGVWRLENFEYIYPIVRQGGHYWSPNEEVKVTLYINDTKYIPEPKILRTPESHAPYVWWKSNQHYDQVYKLDIVQQSYIVAADTIFNEELAKEIPWPNRWPEEAQRYLTPIVDRITDPIDITGQDHLSTLVDKWIEGNDPKSIDQVTLTKFLTGKVLEYVRVVGPSTIYSSSINLSPITNPNNSVISIPRGVLTGFLVRSADQVVINPDGSELDVSTLLTAVLRTAGVPARTVVCYDNNYNTVEEERIVAIVEFAMYDHKRDQVLWIPIDPHLLRDNGRNSSIYKQRWDYFGTHDQLHNIIPLAYFFHPPVKYKAYAFPGFFGFRAKPDIGNRVVQSVAIDVMNSATRGDEVRP